MRVRVAQIGARKGYALVSALARTGHLESLCTDFYYRGAVMRSAAGLCDVLRRERQAATIRSRRCAEVPDQLVRTFPLTGLLNRLRVQRAIASGESYIAYLQGSTAFAKSVSRLSWDGVDTIYGFSSASLEAFEAAKRHGVACILDHETAPAELESEVVRSAEELFAEWLPYKPRTSIPGVKLFAERQKAEADLADSVICPSTFGSRLVRDQGTAPEKVRTIPFAMGESFVRKGARHNGPLRVLFAGNDAIRKGLPVLVEALRKLPPGSFEARGAGGWSLSEFGWSKCREVLEPLGPVPRSEMAKLYEWADVFVLPTFSDTMGVVILEAMASDVPVIATKNSGGPDLVRNGLDGYVIPVNAPTVLAERLAVLSNDRESLSAMSENAYLASRRYTIQDYGKRVVGEVNRILSEMRTKLLNGETR